MVSDGLERRIDIFDESVFIKIFDLEKVLIGIRPEENGQKQLEELQTLYQEIKSAINGRGFINPTLSNVIVSFAFRTSKLELITLRETLGEPGGPSTSSGRGGHR